MELHSEAFLERFPSFLDMTGKGGPGGPEPVVLIVFPGVCPDAVLINLPLRVNLIEVPFGMFGVGRVGMQPEKILQSGFRSLKSPEPELALGMRNRQ